MTGPTLTPDEALRCGDVPCPCGENAEAIHFNGTAAFPEGYVVRCLECGREGYPHDSPTLAAENFRTRHPVAEGK